MLKRILYGSGALTALAGAYLLGSATLGNVFAQSPSPQPPAPAATQAGGGQQEQQPGPAGSIQVPQNQGGQSEADEGAALQSLAKITPDQAKAAALAQYPGATVTKVELGNENGSLVYSVQLTDTAGKSWDVKVDAGTGKVLHAEADGPEGSEGRDGGAESGAED